MKTTQLIRELPYDALPRERLIFFGEKALSNPELLAILLRTGTKEENVMQLAMRVLQTFEDLDALKRTSLEELQQIKGIGKIKAIEIKAMMELGVRISHSKSPKLGQILSTRDAGEWLMKEMSDLHQEYLVVIFLNTKNEIIRKQTIFKGSLNSSVAHPREIFKEAVKYPTARLIIAHNHPSGDTTPSQADIQFTHRMIDCGELMGIDLLDHLIIGESTYLSLREESDVFD